MLHHVVLLRFTAASTPSDIAEISRRFAALPALIPGIQAFAGGEDCSPEGLQQGFTHGWLLSFTDTAARDGYLHHPAHLEFVSFLKPFVDDVLVSDFHAS
ncbi:Dabb family protein [Aquitalea aquatica]|uniref:Dabb family protein n=1 Tax=Aquitalea aquatica TaxID=3044273 RepID=A0A838Y265_9NEIS|nr:Dabb family protein [Aquitalea magnusonii]MBA4707372.1 Dabb family protein [Aquitalea magnusonii]